MRSGTDNVSMTAVFEANSSQPGAAEASQHITGHTGVWKMLSCADSIGVKRVEG